MFKDESFHGTCFSMVITMEISDLMYIYDVKILLHKTYIGFNYSVSMLVVLHDIICRQESFCHNSINFQGHNLEYEHI